ncbi:hypothetical protein [Thiolapillus sp.]|uniref:hypothetical protein n=1 Tax=Thiolapillus sp. TaxID=2017437 RepID=UPI003AF57767
MTRTAGAPIGCQRPSRFWGLGCPKIYHEAEDTLEIAIFFGQLQIISACQYTELVNKPPAASRWHENYAL